MKDEKSKSVASETHEVCWFANTAFAVHKDMKSHTDDMMTSGTEALKTVFSEQKLNAKSLIEAESVKANDTSSDAFWTRNFLNEQCHHVKDNVLFQNNKSAMLLKNNEWMSVKKKSEHINVRHFFLTNRINNSNELRVEHCLINEMTADHFIKPL